MAISYTKRSFYLDEETREVKREPDRVEYIISYKGGRSRRGHLGTEHWTPKSTFYISEEDERLWL